MPQSPITLSCRNANHAEAKRLTTTQHANSGGKPNSALSGCPSPFLARENKGDTWHDRIDRRATEENRQGQQACNDLTARHGLVTTQRSASHLPKSPGDHVAGISWHATSGGESRLAGQETQRQTQPKGTDGRRRTSARPLIMPGVILSGFAPSAPPPKSRPRYCLLMFCRPSAEPRGLGSRVKGSR